MQPTNTPITWTELSVVCGVFGMIFTFAAAFAAWLWKNWSADRKDNGQSFSSLRSELTNFRVEVAREYATNAALLQVETRMSAAIRQIGDQLQVQHRDLIDVLRNSKS